MFVAVWLPVEVNEVLRKLPRVAQGGLRFSSEDQWHATLRFLGDVDPHQVATAIDALVLPRVKARIGPRIERIAPGIVVAPVRGLEPLAATVSVAAIAGQDDRPFVGHVTLAREKRGNRCSLDGAKIDSTFCVTRIALVRSERHSDGARYLTVRSFETKS